MIHIFWGFPGWKLTESWYILCSTSISKSNRAVAPGTVCIPLAQAQHVANISVFDPEKQLQVGSFILEASGFLQSSALEA